jgi:hypothetical protein
VADVENPSAASISGQVVTAAVTGVLAVRYLPAFKVRVKSFSAKLNGPNDVDFTVALDEVLRVPET